MSDHKIFRNKMKKTLALLDDPIVAQHVPDTSWFSIYNLYEMLQKHRVIYIKPNAGKQGNRIIRVRKVSESACEVSYNGETKKIKVSAIESELAIIMQSKKNYLIQKGIDMATYKNRPFDIRVVMQKPFTNWQLTLTSAKVALREDAVVTNVSKGAEDFYLKYILENYDQKEDTLATFIDLIDLSHQIAYLLSVEFPLRIIGLDMAIDKEGKIWFIEANTNPQCAKCKKVNDNISVAKYDQARKIIKSDLSKLKEQP